MTRFAPPTLYQCPSCAGYFTRSGFRSLFFVDAVPDWSDGKNDNWWARASGSVGRCPSCVGIIWIEDSVKLIRAPQKPRPIGAASRLWHLMTGDRSGRLQDEREWAALPREIKEAERIDGLDSAKDFMDALANLPPDGDDREVYLRRRLWWASNDHLRRRTDEVPAGTQPAVAPAVAQANKLRLLELFESDPDNQVERGELLRQLGRFDEAVAVLKAVKPNGYSEVMAMKIERLAAARRAELQDLKAVEVYTARNLVW